MSILIEKKNELLAKKEGLLKERADKIAAKAEAYRISLESTEPIPAEIANIDKVIGALDEVIAYEIDALKPAEPAIVITEAIVATPEETVVIPAVEPVAEIAVEPIATIVEAPIAVNPGREGMAVVCEPERG